MARNVHFWYSLALSMLLSNCAQKQVNSEPIVFPPDFNQPFLTLVGSVGDGVRPEKGFIRDLISKISGPKSVIHPSRPITAAVNSDGDVYVVDLNSSGVLFYENVQDKLQPAVLRGEVHISNPLAIATHNDLVFVAEGVSGSIHKFDSDFNLISTIEVSDLTAPGQIKVNPLTGDLFILDTRGHQVFVTNQDGMVKARLNNENLGKKLFSAPIDVDFTQEGNIVVLDAMTRRVEIFSSDFQYLSGFGDYDQVPGSFAYPRGLSISSDGFLFISDAVFGNIQIFDTRGALLYFWGEIGTEPSQFLMPSALCFDSNDNLYIVDQFNSRVQIYHYVAQ